MRSLYDQIVAGAQVVSTGLNSGSTATSAGVDTKLYSTGVIVAVAGVASSSQSPTTIATLLESTTLAGTYTPALANDGTTIAVTLTGNWSGGSQQAGMARIEGLGLNRKRFLKVQIVSTFASAQSQTSYGEIILGRSQLLPTQTGSNSL